MEKIKILDLGCGKKKCPGSVGVDINPNSDADIIHDLNVFPYPFENSSFEYCFLDNSLEHFDNTIKVMEEIYRILKLEGTCKIIVPYFRSRYAYIDPTHKKFFTIDSFMYFDPDNFYYKNLGYTKAKFKILKISFNETLKKTFFVKVLTRFANKHKHFYEQYLSHYFPLDDITFYLKKI
jgi:ubiquinone/menaquinone biosynthesis C-methylase UbiE